MPFAWFVCRYRYNTIVVLPTKQIQLLCAFKSRMKPDLGIKSNKISFNKKSKQTNNRNVDKEYFTEIHAHTHAHTLWDKKGITFKCEIVYVHLTGIVKNKKINWVSYQYPMHHGIETSNEMLKNAIDKQTTTTPIDLLPNDRVQAITRFGNELVNWFNGRMLKKIGRKPHVPMYSRQLFRTFNGKRARTWASCADTRAHHIYREWIALLHFYSFPAHSVTPAHPYVWCVHCWYFTFIRIRNESVRVECFLLRVKCFYSRLCSAFPICVYVNSHKTPTTTTIKMKKMPKKYTHTHNSRRQQQHRKKSRRCVTASSLIFQQQRRRSRWREKKTTNKTTAKYTQKYKNIFTCVCA